MMKRILILVIVAGIFSNCQNKPQANQNIITSDIANFWVAYDKITSTQDSILQLKYLDSLYFQKGTVGLEGIREARNYTPQDYLSSINNYPKFWSSIRENTLQAGSIGSELETGIEKIKAIYPEF